MRWVSGWWTARLRPRQPTSDSEGPSARDQSTEPPYLPPHCSTAAAAWARAWHRAVWLSCCSGRHQLECGQPTSESKNAAVTPLHSVIHWQISLRPLPLWRQREWPQAGYRRHAADRTGHNALERRWTEIANYADSESHFIRRTASSFCIVLLRNKGGR